jgi:hypothetical protein
MTVLCFIDTETTGLDPRIHEPWEVCLWREDRDGPETYGLGHDLTHADPQALAIGGYWERAHTIARTISKGRLARDLLGVTLVGSNPGFDAAMLTRHIGTSPWHHRTINVADGAMWVFGWDRPKGLADVAEECRARGFDIPVPDHTAEGDVRATRAVYDALRALNRTPGNQVLDTGMMQ